MRSTSSLFFSTPALRNSCCIIQFLRNVEFVINNKGIDCIVIAWSWYNVWLHPAPLIRSPYSFLKYSFNSSDFLSFSFHMIGFLWVSNTKGPVFSGFTDLPLTKALFYPCICPERDMTVSISFYTLGIPLAISSWSSPWNDLFLVVFAGYLSCKHDVLCWYIHIDPSLSPSCLRLCQ